MTRHLADRQVSSEQGRLAQFLRIAHAEGDRFWHVLWRRPQRVEVGSRRAVEFLRIARGREV